MFEATHSMLISRYIFRQTASALIMILVSLTLMMWMMSILREIKLMTSQGQTFFLFLEITSLAIPGLLVMLAPFAFLIATLHTLNRLNGDSELIVLSAAGGSVWRVLTPYLRLAIILSIALGISTNFILPPVARLLSELIAQVRSDVLSQVLQPGEFTELEKGITFHIRDKNSEGELFGVVVYDERNPQEIKTVIADRGEIVSDGQRSVMILKNGQILTRTADKFDVRVINYQNYEFDLADFSQKKGVRDLKPRERDTSALLWPDKNEEYYQREKAKFRSEIHERFSAPLYPIFFAFVAIVYLGRPRTTRQGRTDMLVGAFVVGAVGRILGIPGVNIAGKKLWALSLVYGIPIFGIVLILYMLVADLEPVVISLPSLPKFGRRKKQAAAAT